MLEFKIFNISNGTQPHTGRLPITPGSHLTWFGFSEEGQLSSYDSKVFLAFPVAHIMFTPPFFSISELSYNQILQGILRVFTGQFGGSWLPLFRFVIFSFLSVIII